MPEQNEFLAMIYDNLAECYEEEDLDDVAMEVRVIMILLCFMMSKKIIFLRINMYQKRL